MALPNAMIEAMVKKGTAKRKLDPIVEAVQNLPTPVVNVDVPPTEVTVNVPEQPAPVVNVQSPPPPSYELQVVRQKDGLIDKVIARPLGILNG